MSTGMAVCCVSAATLRKTRYPLKIGKHKYGENVNTERMDNWRGYALSIMENSADVIPCQRRAQSNEKLETVD